MENLKLVESKNSPSNPSHEKVVGEHSFSIRATEPQMTYIDRILEGNGADLTEDHEAKPVEIICIDNLDSIKNILDNSTGISNLSENLIVGETNGGNFVYLKDVFMDILIPQTDRSPLTHVSISKNPEYGAVTFIKSYLLSQYVNKHKALAFHAGSMTSRKGTASVALSALNHSLNSGDNAGKTTAILACCARESANFSFVSNDEVILSHSDAENKIIHHPFPSQITLRGKSLDAIVADGVNFDLEAWKGIDNITGQSVNVISPRGYKEGGFEISKLNPEHLNWCFIEMNHEITDYSLSSCDPERARELFRGAISKRRMNQALGPLYLGETCPSYAFDSSKYQNRLDEMFELLVTKGIKFYIVRSGTDRNKVNELFSKITE